MKGGRAIVPNPSNISISPASAWVIAAIAAFIVELVSPTFGFLFVGVGALVAAALAALGLSLVFQLACFTVVVLLCLVFLRPHFVKRLGAQGVPTRTDALMGSTGNVTVAIEPATGAGRVDVCGQDWAARSPQSLAPGTRVVVEGADGIVLLVRPAEPPDGPS